MSNTELIKKLDKEIDYHAPVDEIFSSYNYIQIRLSRSIFYRQKLIMECLKELLLRP